MKKMILSVTMENVNSLTHRGVMTMFDGFGDVSLLHMKRLLALAKEHVDGADILSQQVHFDISELERAFGKQLFNCEPNLKECARTIDLLLKELLVELEKRGFNGI